MRFNPNPSEVTAGNLVLDKDTYTFEVAGITPYAFSKDPANVRHGVRVDLVVTSDGKYKGKRVSYLAGHHDELNLTLTKRLQMAILGFNPYKSEEEAKFNDEYGPADWSYDTDAKTTGDAWKNLKGKLVCCDCDQKPDKTDLSKIYQMWAFKPYLP